LYVFCVVEFVDLPKHCSKETMDIDHIVNNIVFGSGIWRLLYVNKYNFDVLFFGCICRGNHEIYM